MFNELSLTKVDTKASALSFLNNFVNATIVASEAGFSEIRMYEGAIQTFYQIPIWDNYNIDKWLADDEVNTDLKDKFRLLVGTFPLLKGEEIANEEFSRSEFTHNLEGQDRNSFGLGAAYLYNTLSISLYTHACWNNTIIPLKHFILHHDGTDETVDVQTRHFFDIESLKSHLEWWENLQLESLEKSAELWDKRTEFFPNLVFTQEVENQIKKLGFSKFLFQVIDRLKSLNEYAKDWTKGDFNVIEVNETTNLRISTESDITLRSYGTLRKFTIPTKGKKVFDLHIKTGDLRFHFFPDETTHTIYIGYIGKHLRTVRFK